MGRFFKAIHCQLVLALSLFLNKVNLTIAWNVQLSANMRSISQISKRPISPSQQSKTSDLDRSRRHLLCEIPRIATISAFSMLVSPSVASAKSTPKQLDPEQLVGEIVEARDTLQKLLDNWQRAVIDCTYADVPRELLESKNKEQLLEKASTYALFDKSVAVVSCKTTNRLVRDYIGATGKGPVVGLEKKLRLALPLVQDDVEVYLGTVEEISQNIAKAESLSYTAGVADFASVNNFDEKDIDSVLTSNSNLEQTRQTIRVTVQGLNAIIPLIQNSM